MPRIVGVIVTFHVVVLGWIFFRAESFGTAIAYLRGLAGGAAMPTDLMVTPLAVALILFGMGVHFTPPLLGQRIALRLRVLPAPVLGLIVGVTILIVDAMRFEGVAPFIYYQF